MNLLLHNISCLVINDGQKLTKTLLTDSVINLFKLDQWFN